MRISDWSSDVCSSVLLRRFVVDICGCETLWTAAHIIDDQVARVREQVGSDEVILGLSGGVDSSVVAALLHRAIGDQLTCVFVDTGLPRWQRSEEYTSELQSLMRISYAVFCLKKKKTKNDIYYTHKNYTSE